MEPEFHSIESLTTWRPLSTPPSPTPLGQVSPTSETVDTSSIVSVRELVKIFEVSQQKNYVVISYPKRRSRGERLLPRVPPKPLSSILVSNQPRRVVLRKVVFLTGLFGSFCVWEPGPFCGTMSAFTFERFCRRWFQVFTISHFSSSFRVILGDGNVGLFNYS